MKRIPLILLCLLVLSCDKEEDITKGLPEEITFNNLPTDLSKTDSFAAIGQLQGLPKSHGGFTMKEYYLLEPDIPVYAMSDGIIYNIRYEQVTSNHPGLPPELQGKYYDDYTLEIQLTKTAKMHFGHLSELAPEILEAAGNISFGRGVENRVNIPIEEGQIIAYIGRHPGFDIGLTDTKRQAYFANPERYSQEYMGSLPFTDFMPASLRNQVWTVNPRTAEPRGGQVAYDVEGTLSGNWFLQGTTSLLEWSKQLVIARHELWGDRITIMDGSPLFDGDGQLNNGIAANLWWIKGNAPDPKSITPSDGMIKYEVAAWWNQKFNSEHVDGTILFELTADGMLKFEYFDGMTSDEVTDFSPNVRIYER